MVEYFPLIIFLVALVLLATSSIKKIYPIFKAGQKFIIKLSDINLSSSLFHIETKSIYKCHQKLKVNTFINRDTDWSVHGATHNSMNPKFYIFENGLLLNIIKNELITYTEINQISQIDPSRLSIKINNHPYYYVIRFNSNHDLQKAVHTLEKETIDLQVKQYNQNEIPPIIEGNKVDDEVFHIMNLAVHVGINIFLIVIWAFLGVFSGFLIGHEANLIPNWNNGFLYFLLIFLPYLTLGSIFASIILYMAKSSTFTFFCIIPRVYFLFTILFAIGVVFDLPGFSYMAEWGKTKKTQIDHQYIFPSEKEPFQKDPNYNQKQSNQENRIKESENADTSFYNIENPPQLAEGSDLTFEQEISKLSTWYEAEAKRIMHLNLEVKYKTRTIQKLVKIYEKNIKKISNHFFPQINERKDHYNYSDNNLNKFKKPTIESKKEDYLIKEEELSNWYENKYNSIMQSNETNLVKDKKIKKLTLQYQKKVEDTLNLK
ncbi:hypothetical protein N9N67_00305 [Bacteriovoracaceae bacterium]|nr:hypothetical protein [Bacteriovoracaceae bacterium]